MSPPRSKMCALLAVVAAVLGCGGSSPTSPNEAIFLVRACATDGKPGELFRFRTRNSSVIAEATAAIGAGGSHIVSGPPAAGDGGFNAPWHWHHDPNEVRVVAVAAEGCDGCPSDVEADLAYWLNLGQFCPWTSEILARER